MLDIKVVRQDPERVKQAVKNRNGNLDKEVDQLLELDLQRREIITAVEELKAKQNSVSKMIPQYKKEGKDQIPAKGRKRPDFGGDIQN